ncbi:T9SS type A sorting domain-containing protein [Neolewinella aurantiaca]|uniref:T9SS type A sorting domain-containing protein n=1 Tax=Neolewinella aurantiaca TaxID=2602767 RepID=A0A5C7FEC9_9BACT|nr:T9SS type A sorting domain-containing protein [Neolewinella aurantiaca]TXF85657.1 T9SS type A sorting domain-containing protein [Neolewinella aurantiaca]
MKLVLRAFLLVLASLTSVAIWAQTDSVNVAVIANINITLDDACRAIVIPEQVLAGEFDADEDGVSAPLSAFQVIVEDGNESNLDTIDGCGTYLFRVEADAALVSGFTTGWGTVVAEDKTAPFFTSTPVAPAGPLYCEAILGVDLSTLPNTVSRCYTVNTFSNTVVSGTLDPALEARLLAGGGLPGATDNCSELVEICVNDIVTRDPLDPQCNDVLLTRTFTATDGSCVSAGGETNAAAVTSYEIVFTRPSLDDLNTDNVPDVVVIECGELDALGLVFGDVPAPRTQDLPFFNGPNGTTIPLQIGDNASFCGIGVTFTDSAPIVTCDLAYKVVRTYTVIDWCNTSDVRTFSQVVKIGDFTAPEFTAPSAPLEYLTNGGDECGAFIRLDLSELSVTDVCGSSVSLSASIYLNGDLTSAPLGSYPVNLDNNTAEISELLPLGDHVVRYHYIDECGNFGETDVDVTIQDGTPPVAICEDGLNVSVTSSVSPDPNASAGIAILTPENIDNGSYDDCSDITMSIARVRLLDNGTYELLPGAAYGPQVVLTCDDAGEVLIGLKVTDANNLSNYCWMTVLVEDKTAPSCFAPANLKLSCVEFDAAGLPDDITEASDVLLDASFGTATGFDNCDVTLTQTVSGSVNSCGIGTITRRFVATDAAGFTNTQPCVQTVEISGLHDYIIRLPGDDQAFCMQDPTVGELEVEENGCDLITTQISRDTFTGTADECFKVRIEHLIVNWCEYNTLGEPYLVPRDYDGDNNLREDVYLYVRPLSTTTLTDDVAYLDGDNIFGNNNFSDPLDAGPEGDSNNPYGTDDSRGAFRYYQYVKIHDETAPQVVAEDVEECFLATEANCTGAVSLTFELTDNCTRQDQLGFRVELDLDYVETVPFSRTRFLLDNEVTNDAEGNFFVSLENVPVGSHAIRVRGTDGCGNVDVVVIEFCVEDGLAPTPICILQTTVTLSPNGDGTGSAAYWATDGIASDVADCSGDVTYSIYKELEAQAPGFVPAPGRDGIIFDCDDDQTVPIRIYAFDPVGQNDYCEIFILVQGAENACASENFGNISGAIATVDGEPVEDVTVSLVGPEASIVTATTAGGLYNFQDLTAREDYTIDPTHESYVLHSHGVSTFDLVLITRYILGLEYLGSPYQYLAADANGDEDVSVQDIIAIRRLILGLDDAYRNNSAWRFVDVDFVFPVNTNPWATSFPEVVNINNLDGSVRNVDFIAIMIGDVSGNDPSNFANNGSTPRNGRASLEVSELEMKAGETYEVAVSANEAAALSGLQGTMSVTEDVRILEIISGQLSAGHLNDELLDRGHFAFSYDRSPVDAEPMLTLRLEAVNDARLSDVLSVSDALVRAEGYTPANAVVGLNVAFANDAAAVENAQLFQNTPNPVYGQTTIRFDLPAAGDVQLTIRDINGRVLTERSISASAGQNQVQLDRKDLGVSGVLTYTLSAEGFTATRKMVVK